jgi:hypothetical protein
MRCSWKLGVGIGKVFWLAVLIRRIFSSVSGGTS